MANTLKIDRGTTFPITFTYKKNGVATSLVGSTVRFTVKTAEFDTDDTDASAKITKNVTNGASDGTCTITIDPTDTQDLTPGKYYYDIKVDELGDGTLVYKAVEGTISLDASPTNRLS